MGNCGIISPGVCDPEKQRAQDNLSVVVREYSYR